jgi:integrase/recombinase XerC
MMEGEAPSYAEAVAQWIHHLGSVRGYAASSLEAYRRDALAFEAFYVATTGEPIGWEALAQAEIGLFRAWMAESTKRGLRVLSRRRYLSSLRHLMRYAIRQGWLRSTRLMAVRRPKMPVTLPRHVSESEIMRWMEAMASEAEGDWQVAQDRLLGVVLYGMGLRISEALSLQWRDIWPLRRYWRIVGKGKKHRDVPVLPWMDGLIVRYRQESTPFGTEGPVFRGARGAGLLADVARRRMRGWRARLGLPEHLTPHALRHSFATHLLGGGASLVHVQKLLGHAQLTTTERYTVLAGDQLRTGYYRFHPEAE